MTPRPRNVQLLLALSCAALGSGFTEASSEPQAFRKARAQGVPAESAAQASQASQVPEAPEAPPAGVDNSFYRLAVVPMMAATLCVAYFTRPKVEVADMPPGFRRFQWTYLGVWAMAACADWLQGPYVYALYASYGYSAAAISELFVVGFASSALFGMLVGSFADAYGRKRCAVAYYVLYILSCLTKHFKAYPILMLGRITGGMATSMLFSTFECWMVGQHVSRHNFGQPLLRYMFSLMYSINYVVAIAAGLVAQLGVDAVQLKEARSWGGFYYGGNTVPFDFSILVLLAAIPVTSFLWEENYGDASAAPTLFESLRAAVGILRSSWRVSALGVVDACFQGAMYAFVLKWTPALDATPPPPHGTIFSTLMMACMMGSSMFSLFHPNVHPGRVLLAVCIGATLALLVAASSIGRPTAIPSVFWSFIAFEACVGLYFPAMGALKSHVVPDHARAGVYNAYRVPLNVVVVMVTLIQMPLGYTFLACSLLLATASVVSSPLALPSGGEQGEAKTH